LATYGKPRFLGIVELDDGVFAALPSCGMIIAASHRGEEAALVMGPLNEEQEREYRGMKTISERGEGPARGGEPVVSDLEFIRAPSDDDMERWRSRRASEDGILRDAQEMAGNHDLELKLIDAETMIDGKKLFFYFTSETRVDFRTLVKDLARRFRTRIELRQMGVRDEARIISGLASCGLPCCCSYWLNQFAPIGIKMVKEQNIALNPSKISGICGRLMCCMSFEHKVYKNLWAGLPGPGSKIKTPNGNYVIAAMDVAHEAVRCHKPGGGDVAVPISMFQEFRAAVMNGDAWEPPAPEVDEEVESAPLRKCGCACRFTSGCASAAESPDEPADAARDSSGDDQARRQGHKRGRRGGRRHRPDASPEHSHEQARERPRPPRPQDSAKGDEAREASAPQARRKRRRPRRGAGAASQEN
jgi:cell fate regulator YaaT (PSP1 superfamily)